MIQTAEEQLEQLQEDVRAIADLIGAIERRADKLPVVDRRVEVLKESLLGHLSDAAWAASEIGS